MSAIPNVNFAVKTWGPCWCRAERATLTARGIANTFYGVRVLWFKIWLCKI